MIDSIDSIESLNSEFVNSPNLDNPENLDDLVKIDYDTIFKYDSQCLRKKMNWSNPSIVNKFDFEEFDPKLLLNNISSHSPKLDALLKKIKELDNKDMKTEGKLYKHFIFSDLKSGGYGAKLLASAMIASGFNLGYSAPKKTNEIRKPVAEPISELNASPVNSTIAKPSIFNTISNSISNIFTPNTTESAQIVTQPPTIKNSVQPPTIQPQEDEIKLDQEDDEIPSEESKMVGGAGDDDDDNTVYVDGKKKESENLGETRTS